MNLNELHEERASLARIIELTHDVGGYTAPMFERIDALDREIALVESGFDFDAFVVGYVDCILWCDCQWAEEDQHPSGESGGREGLELREGVYAEIIEAGQLREFVVENLDDLLLYCAACETGEREFYDWSQGSPESYAGHDFYLTRAGHGAGFWDRGLGELGDRLTEAAKAAGSVDDHILYDCGDGTASL